MGKCVSSEIRDAGPAPRSPDEVPELRMPLFQSVVADRLAPLTAQNAPADNTYEGGQECKRQRLFAAGQPREHRVGKSHQRQGDAEAAESVAEIAVGPPAHGRPVETGGCHDGAHAECEQRELRQQVTGERQCVQHCPLLTVEQPNHYAEVDRSQQD